MKHQPGDLC